MYEKKRSQVFLEILCHPAPSIVLFLLFPVTIQWKIGFHLLKVKKQAALFPETLVLQFFDEAMPFQRLQQSLAADNPLDLTRYSLFDVTKKMRHLLLLP